MRSESSPAAVIQLRLDSIVFFSQMVHLLGIEPTVAAAIRQRLLRPTTGAPAGHAIGKQILVVVGDLIRIHRQVVESQAVGRSGGSR